jgi:poly(hydroxyalkanoate) depolymerase family esterase
MIRFNAGATRPATGDARLSAANDLVRRTLARHGLMPGPDGRPGGATRPPAFAMEELLARVRAPGGAGTRPEDPIPEGAEFRRGRHACPDGSRLFRTYVPSTAAAKATGIVVMLHGCTQSPEDFAAGTGMNALAERDGFVVVYPEQSRGDNAQSCWNWFSRGDQRRGRGEPAILAGLTREAMTEHGVPRDRTFVAGLSAGAAMAVILGETYGDVFAAVGAHSGLPYGAARDVPSAFAAMAGNASEMPTEAPAKSSVRTIVFHGTADATVHPCNGEAISRDAARRGPDWTIQSETRGETAGRWHTRMTTATADGSVAHEYWVVEGLGHAWSGGRSGGSYTDAKGPDASAEMIRFFFGRN